MIMIRSYITIALRNLQKNKLYAGINILGLATGICIFLLSIILVRHEFNFDRMFANSDRIFVATSVFSPTANIGYAETDSLHSAATPHFQTDIPDLEAVARSKRRDYLLTKGDRAFYEQIHFTDYSFVDIFDFTYLSGSAEAFKNPSTIFLTRDTAIKYFGHIDVLGEELRLDHEHVVQVGAVIENPPADSHFSTWPLDESPLVAISPLPNYERIANYVADEDWNNMSTGDLTYLLIPQEKTKQWLQQQVDGVYERHYSKEHKRFITAIKIYSISAVNTLIWNMIGIPALESVQLLGLLILIIACINYTNLATAQNLGRLSEVGLRKTFGANRRQLLLQFLIESITLVLIGTALALAMVELILPFYNQAMGREVHINYVFWIPALLLIATVVGVCAGAYPAWQITRSKTLSALKSEQTTGQRGVWLRNIMVGGQFAVSTIMLAMVLTITLQNDRTEQSKYVFPVDEIVLLNNMSVEEIQSAQDTLRQELLQIPEVSHVTFTSQVPFRQSDSSWPATPEKGDSARKFGLSNIAIDEFFLDTYNVPLLAGRNLDPNHSNDIFEEDRESLNVLVNELAVQKLGFGSPAEAIGKRFYRPPGENASERPDREFVIVGVMANRNFKGLHNREKPYVFRYIKEDFRTAAVRIQSKNVKSTLAAIDASWQQVVPNYPIQRMFQDELFEEIFGFMRMIGQVMSAFALLALGLALIGLFGLAAFLAERRTREIGIRKTLGASIWQIVQLLVWQFSKPVIWAILLALPVAYFASGVYLNFFADHIESVVPLLLVASLAALLTAWFITAIHAIRVARRSPIFALRHE
jgi:putative ABC transport system permease protein